MEDMYKADVNENKVSADDFIDENSDLLDDISSL